MTKRTPDQTVQPFEHRAGTQEVPTIGGMSRLGDEAQIPLRQHHLLVNVRFGPGEMASRPGLTEVDDVGVEACITGLIETLENTGTGAGVVSGLLTSYWYGQGPTVGLEHFLYLNPQDDQIADPDLNESRALIKQPAIFGAGAHVWETFWPMGGVESHYWAASGCGPCEAIPGPFGAFEFQGNTCVLGGYPELGLFAIVAPDDDGSGALSRLTIFGSYVPVSQAIRQEIIGGEVKDVLYFGATDGIIYRFDGVTLSEWFDTLAVGGQALYCRPFVSGQEMLILGDHQQPVVETGSALPPGTGTFESGALYYQAAPGQPINLCSWAVEYATYDGAETANRSIGFTGAARYRDKWFVVLQSAPGNRHGGTPQQYSQILQATVGGPTLTFTLALRGYAAVPPVRTSSSLNFGWLTVHKDVLYFVSVESQITDADGPCEATDNPNIGDSSYYLGKYDGSTWTPQYHPLLAATGDYYTNSQVGWMISNGEELMLSEAGVEVESQTGSWENIRISPEPDTALSQNGWVYNPVNDISHPDPPPGGEPLASKSAYFAIPDEDA